MFFDRYGQLGTAGTWAKWDGRTFIQDPNGNTAYVTSAGGINALKVDVEGFLGQLFTPPQAVSDNFLNPTPLMVGSFGLLWDGVTWDRAKGNSTDGALVNLGANNDVDTELPAPAALSDTFANPTAPAVGAFSMKWSSGASQWLRWDGNVGITGTLPAFTVTPTFNVGTFPDNEPFNVAQFGGAAVATGAGPSGAGVPRVTVAMDAVTANAPAAASVGVASASALATNAARKAVFLKNTSNATISCAESGQTAVLNSGITLEPGDAYAMVPPFVTTGQVNCIASAAASNLSILEKQ